MNKRTISVEEEEHELTTFLDFLDSKESNVKEHYMESFLRDKLDPMNKIVVSAYDRYNNSIIQIKTSDFRDLDDKLTARSFQKLKLQIRLENIKDIENLIYFLQTIRFGLKEISDEEDINDKRLKILNDILNEPEPVTFNLKNNYIW
jgi:hypothetical protein